MAQHTRVGRLSDQLLYIIGNMGVMACEAFPFRFKTAMLNLYLRDPFFFVTVTFKA
jgi:hypothetical protein